MNGIFLSDGAQLFTGEIIDLTYTPEDNSYDEIVADFFKKKTFTFDSHVSQRDLLSIILGKKVTNNYLKMRGGIMSRKVKNKFKTYII